MWWATAAQAGLQLLGGFNQSQIAKGQAQAQGILEDAQYEASETVRKAGNDLGRRQASLANWARSVSNQRLVEAAGEQYNAFSENLGRLMDQSVKGDLSRRIQAAEQMGALTASAAAAGVGGSTTNLISGTMRLRNAILNQEIENQAGQASYDMLMQRAGVMQNAYDQWDFTYNADQADLVRDVKPIRVAQDDVSWKTVFLETSFGAVGNLFKGGGSSAGPASLLTKLGMGGNQAGAVASLSQGFGSGNSGTSVQGGGTFFGGGNAGTPMQGGGTFFGIDPSRNSGARLRL